MTSPFCNTPFWVSGFPIVRDTFNLMKTLVQTINSIKQSSAQVPDDSGGFPTKVHFSLAGWTPFSEERLLINQPPPAPPLNNQGLQYNLQEN